MSCISVYLITVHAGVVSVVNHTTSQRRQILYLSDPWDVCLGIRQSSSKIILVSYNHFFFQRNHCISRSSRTLEDLDCAHGCISSKATAQKSHRRKIFYFLDEWVNFSVQNYTRPLLATSRALIYGKNMNSLLKCGWNLPSTCCLALPGRVFCLVLPSLPSRQCIDPAAVKRFADCVAHHGYCSTSLNMTLPLQGNVFLVSEANELSWFVPACSVS